MSESAGATTTQTLEQLEQRRQLLQQLIGVTAVIENLKLSLAQMLGNGIANQQVSHATSLNQLEDGIQDLPDSDIRQRLEVFDRNLRALYGKLFPVIEEIQAAESPVEVATLASAVSDAASLRQLVQAAMAVRILLSQRGQPVPEFRLPLDRARLEQQLQTVTDKEHSARQAVIQQVCEMEQDLKQLLAQTDLPAAMRSLMEQMLSGLKDNLEHLRAGRSVRELPLPVEATSFVEPSPPEQPSTKPSSPSSPAPDIASDVSPDIAPEPAPAPPGLWRAILMWVSSPLDVSWQDIRSGRYQRDRKQS